MALGNKGGDTGTLFILKVVDKDKDKKKNGKSIKISKDKKEKEDKKCC